MHAHGLDTLYCNDQVVLAQAQIICEVATLAGNPFLTRFTVIVTERPWLGWLLGAFYAAMCDDKAARWTAEIGAEHCHSLRGRLQGYAVERVRQEEWRVRIEVSPLAEETGP
jgi:hypothetical protein